MSAPSEPSPVQRSTVYSHGADDVSPSILIHHEHTNVVSPADHSGSFILLLSTEILKP